MAKKRRHHIPIFTTRATATLSVALVLVILGLATFIGIGTRRVADSVRSSIGFVVILNPDVTADEIEAITAPLRECGAMSACTFSTSAQILERWQQMVGEGEDIINLAGVNPFNPELEINVTPAYATADSIDALASSISLMPQVSDIAVHPGMMNQINRTLSTIRLVLFIIGAALLLVSFVLIFNTVRLSVYAKRFLINTMQLVGATNSFVRHPFISANIVNGLVAGLLASGFLAGLIAYLRSLDTAIADALDWPGTVIVCLGIIATGIIICAVAAYFAANRYLRLTYDEMFR